MEVSHGHSDFGTTRPRGLNVYSYCTGDKPRGRNSICFALEISPKLRVAVDGGKESEEQSEAFAAVDRTELPCTSLGSFGMAAKGNIIGEGSREK